MLQNFFEKSRFLVIIVIINCIISSIFLYLSTIYLLIDTIIFIIKNIYATNFEVKIVVVKFLKILDVSLIAITFHLISAGFYNSRPAESPAQFPLRYQSPRSDHESADSFPHQRRTE